jgi:hypothetical protein
MRGDAVVAALRELAARVSLVVVSRDFHPVGHCSFTPRGGPWPPHCVIGTAGAALDPGIDAIAQLIVSKGTDPDFEQYSAFDGTGLGDLLRARGVHHVVIGRACHRLLREGHRPSGPHARGSAPPLRWTRCGRSISSWETASERWARSARRVAGWPRTQRCWRRWRPPADWSRPFRAPGSAASTFSFAMCGFGHHSPSTSHRLTPPLLSRAQSLSSHGPMVPLPVTSDPVSPPPADLA